MTGLHTEAYRRFASALTASRQAAGLSQRELASKLNVNHTYVVKYEGGRQRLDVVEFLRVCQAIGCDPKAVINDVLLGSDLS